MKKYVWIPLCILLIGLIILLYRLGDQYMWTDEVFSFNAAKMIIEKGEPLYDSGLFYSRSSIYHNLLAKSMEIFGINEFGSRILNIPFILGSSLLIYFSLLKKNWRLALTSSLIFLTTNFTLALARETRMYAMAQFVFLVLAISFYKAFLLLKKFLEKRKLDPLIYLWGTLILLFGYLTYNTQPIAGIFILSIALFLFLLSILKKKEIYFYLSVLSILSLFGLIYLRYDTLNIFEWFNSLSPDWAQTVVPTYYAVITARNIPWVALSIYPILLFVFKKRKIEYIYGFSIILSFTVFLSFQSAQHERYWQFLIPIIILISLSSLFDFYKTLKKRKLKLIFLISCILTILIPHTYLFVKELNEIDTHTPTSISIHKKMKYRDTMRRLENIEKPIIADYHSAFTLIAYGFDVEYVVVERDVVERDGRDYEFYFNTPYLVYEKEYLDGLEEDYIFILRDLDPYLLDDFEVIVN